MPPTVSEWAQYILLSASLSMQSRNSYVNRFEKGQHG